MLTGIEIAREQLREIAATSDGSVQVNREVDLGDEKYQFDISIRFDGLERVKDGLPVRAREQFQLIVGPTFPFNYPYVLTPHKRFSGFDHVQGHRQLCLYQSPTDWRPADGMYGYVSRLDSWIRNAARNNLDPDDAPLHPPVEYPSVMRVIVPKANTPTVSGTPWIGYAELRKRTNHTEIVSWRTLDQECPAQSALTILLPERFPFEYPKTVDNLFDEIKPHYGNDYSFLFELCTHSTRIAPKTALTVVIGSPMRRVVGGGPRLQHLAVWEIPAADADKLRALEDTLHERSELRIDEALKPVAEWAFNAKVGWCYVLEMRPEVTQRRDFSAPMTWFRGKRVAIWGCGAIGSHVAESVVRAGASRVELVDNKIVKPGLLVRQSFEEVDIGTAKARALEKRLKRIEPDLEVAVSTDDLIQRIAGPDALPGVDLLIDCTASLAVRTSLERKIRGLESRPPVASISVDGRATGSMATLSMPNHTGCTLDLVRRLKLEACRKPTLVDLLDAFWPKSTERQRFQPEPGCSEPTFVGSNADLATHSARMLNAIARALASPSDDLTGSGWLANDAGPIHAFSWSRDYAFEEEGRGYSVRVCRSAMRELRGWARQSACLRGPRIETGGLIFGELNQAAGVAWVTDAEGPPPDSSFGEDHFTCGIEGMESLAKEKLDRFRGSVECLGSWHTHPTSVASPSDVDIGAVLQLLSGSASSRRNVLLLILSGSPDAPSLGAYAYKATSLSDGFDCIDLTAAATCYVDPPTMLDQDIGLALSGGGSRAIAFHLGCMRALHNLDLLHQVKVISSVSGGSVIGAMYAYSSDSFQAFDERVVALLRRGLQRDILRQVFKPRSIWRALYSLSATCVISVIRIIKTSIQSAFAATRTDAQNLAPPIRKFSRTEAFRDVIKKSLFHDLVMRDVKRPSLHTVVNATELRTGSAFRFGSKESGCWRFGIIPPKDALVADAVAASAAYPTLLPALDRLYEFESNGSSGRNRRVVLSDGGVFENLATGPLAPGRASGISTNIFSPDYIICCDAGAGLFDDKSYPIFWIGRTRRSFLTTFRKVQDATRKRLHELAESGKIKGFVLCYLGQNDDALPWIPPSLPSRSDVQNYPTDFAAMDPRDIDRLAHRGEMLARLQIAYYLPDL